MHGICSSGGFNVSWPASVMVVFNPLLLRKAKSDDLVSPSLLRPAGHQLLLRTPSRPSVAASSPGLACRGAEMSAPGREDGSHEHLQEYLHSTSTTHP